MKRRVSLNASEDLGLMDTFLSRPKPKRWIFSRISQQIYKANDRLRKLALSFEPREIHVNERLLEVPFVLQRVPKEATVLDVGCSGSALALQLACLGHKVSAVDVRPYPFQHKNLTFLQEDISRCSLRKESHDVAVLISTLEHMGLGSYGDSKGMSDVEFLRTVAMFVKPGGRILLTFPYGKRFEGSWYRVYDADGLQALLSEYHVVEHLFARRTSLLSFELCGKGDLRDVMSESLPVNGVAMIEVRKR